MRCVATEVPNCAWICLATASGAPIMGAMAILACAACGGAVGEGSATAVGDGLDEEPSRLLPVSQPARPKAIKNAIPLSAKGDLARRAAAVSTVVTMTSPLDEAR